MTCNARRGTPFNGLEVILDVPPIDLYIKAESTKAAFRNLGTNDEVKAGKGHIKTQMDILDDLGLLNKVKDNIGKEHVWEKRYQTSITKTGGDISNRLRCYTDGSRTNNGTGAGFCLMEGNKVTKTRSYPLSKSATVFQAEIYAIRMAVPFIRHIFPEGSDINIICDSQAAIQALEEVDTKSLGVKHCKNALNSLGRTRNITINWIKAHVNHKGNKLADLPILPVY